MVKEPVRKFAIVIVDDFTDEIVDRFDLDYAEAPKNLGFEFEFTSFETRLTTYFTSAREKKLATTLNINFVPPYAYAKAQAFRQFVQKHLHDTMVFEYNDTESVKMWEGKIQKFGQEELTDWGGLVCPISFLPATPKYYYRRNVITASLSPVGKSYPFTYPYAYSKTVLSNNRIQNTYFDDVPLRVIIHGTVANPVIRLSDSSGKIYSQVQFNGLTVNEGQHLLIDAIRSKILLWDGLSYSSAYDFVDKTEGHDTFLFAKGNETTSLTINLSPFDTGRLEASYRQYTL